MFVVNNFFLIFSIVFGALKVEFFYLSESINFPHEAKNFISLSLFNNLICFFNLFLK